MEEGNQIGEFCVKHVPGSCECIFWGGHVAVLQKLYSLEELDSEQIEKDVPQMIESLQHIVLCSIKNSPYF